MLAIFSILVAEILFSFITLLWKDLRKAGADSLSNLSIFVFSIPFLFILWIILNRDYVFIPSPEYFLLVGLWLLPVFIYNVGNVYLTKYRGLTELSAYRLGFSTLIAIAADILFLDTKYNLLTILAIGCFFFSAYLLTQSRLEFKLSLMKTVMIIFLLSILEVFEYAIYKKALLLQAMPLFTVIIAQSALAILFFIAGHRSLVKNMRAGIIKPYHIILITLLFVPFTILETLGLGKLPIAVVILAAVCPLLVYSLYDMRTSEVKISPRVVWAFLGLIAGSILISI